MARNIVAVIAGVFLTFLLTIAGGWLAWVLIVGNVNASENKDAIVRVTLWQMFCVVPLICVAVGGVVASIARRSAWLLGGVAVLPIFVYGLIRGAHVVEIALFIAYVGLAFAAAFAVSRFKRSRPA
jgi:hypothetical protein